jgi:hypothetical protein
MTGAQRIVNHELANLALILPVDEKPTVLLMERPAHSGKLRIGDGLTG